jgi:hypothetical protein
VYQYDTSASTAWTTMRQLTGPTAADELYGSSVAMVYDTTTGVLTIAVGAPGAASAAGSVWIHRYTDVAWNTQQLTSDAAGSFGANLALSGSVLAVGEPSHSTNQGGDCELHNNTHCSHVRSFGLTD